jgi:type I restriction enzyme S subunit
VAGFLDDSPKNWRIVPFGEIVSDSAFGPRFSGDLYADDGNVATLRTTDLDDDGRISYETMPLATLDLAKFERHLLKIGDLVITRSGTCGIAAIFDGFEKPVLPGAFLIRFRLNEQVDVRFFRYFFNSEPGRKHVLSVAAGAVQQNLNITNLEKLLVPVPPLPVQHRISDILSAHDDLIENNTRRIEILEEMARTIYREWFVHFRFPGHEKVHTVDSPLGKIPEGWEVKKLGDVIELAYGKALKEQERLGGPVPVFGSSGVVGYHNEPYVKGPGIIVGRKGNVGSVFWSDVDFYPIDTVFFVRTELSLPYVFYDLQHQNFISGDAAVPGLSRNAAYLKPFLVPGSEVLKMFEQVIMPVFNQLRTLQDKNENLRRTRDMVLPKLVSGKINLQRFNAA